MNPAVAEANAGIGCGQQYLSAGFIVGRILNHPNQMPGDHLNGLRGPDVGDGVGSLIGRAHLGMLGCRSLVIGQSGHGFQRMGELVQSGAGGNHLGKRSGIIGVYEAFYRPQRAVRNTGFGLHFQKIKNGHAGRFAARAGSCRNRHQWF